MLARLSEKVDGGRQDSSRANLLAVSKSGGVSDDDLNALRRDLEALQQSCQKNFRDHQFQIDDKASK